ncbi:beta-ketoacyl-[acyl-carrier-protein] synthase family protein [bacterium]|nr:beta-ketoacyl-[acyl-carrier-protein] synthase family protein [bacterium]
MPRALGEGRVRLDEIRAVITTCELMTPYGLGEDACWDGLMSGKTAVKKLKRLDTNAFRTLNAAIAPDLNPNADSSLVMQMLSPIMRRCASLIPPDASTILATTVGEIDLLERHVLRGDNGPDRDDSRLDLLLKKVMRLFGTDGPGMVISAACVSSTAAVGRAAEMVRRMERDCVLVVACDCVSEFVFSGFSSLMALDTDMARPFDKNRNGLTLGEAAGLVLVMSEDRARRESRPVLGEVLGLGLSNDAHHMTGPLRDGSGLAIAIRKALESSGIDKGEIDCVSAHGTATVYNDAMEIRALKSALGERSVPTFSIKGAIGHTLGAAGLIEVIITLRALKEGVLPPTIGLLDIDDDARGWVSNKACRIDGEVALSTSAGFGGINGALVLRA